MSQVVSCWMLVEARPTPAGVVSGDSLVTGSRQGSVAACIGPCMTGRGSSGGRRWFDGCRSEARLRLTGIRRGHARENRARA